MNELITQVKNGRIEGPKTVLLLTEKQKKHIDQTVLRTGSWSLLTLNPSQMTKLRDEAGIEVKEVLTHTTYNKNSKKERTFAAISNNYAIRFDLDHIEISHNRLDPNEDFESYKKVLTLPPGSSIRVMRFEPYAESEKGTGSLLREKQISILEQFDLDSIGQEDWISGNSREFYYMKLTDQKVRSQFVMDYMAFLARRELENIELEKRIMEAVKDGTYFSKMNFVPYSSSYEFALKWWKRIAVFKEIEQEKPDIARNWVKESLLDAIELSFRCFDRNRSDDDERHFHKSRRNYYLQLLHHELEREPAQLRDEIVEDIKRENR